jgi:hypothetical protein
LNVFTGQRVQAVAAAAMLYLPATQIAHDAAPLAEYVPLAHSSHVLMLSAPTAALAVPASQSVHQVDPADELYVPASQLTQDVAPAAALAYVPLAHSSHVLMLSAPTAALAVPASQSVHPVDPADELYVPAPQLTQSSAESCKELLPASSDRYLRAYDKM